MIEALIAAGASVVVGIFSLIGVAITNSKSNSKMQSNIEKTQAVTQCQIEELTREVREHNNFAKRMPKIEEQIKVINHRIADLEEMHKPRV